MKQVGAVDATTNPSILLAASKLDDYKQFLDGGVTYAKKCGSSLSREEVKLLGKYFKLISGFRRMTKLTTKNFNFSFFDYLLL